MRSFKNAYKFAEDILPEDSCHQVSDKFYLEAVIHSPDIQTVVDLGCGAGNSVDYFRKVKPDIRWIGVDIESSPEVNSRRRTDAEFMVFDEVHLPFTNGEIDLIYCHQALEHVRSPQRLFKEVQRVLRPGGIFIGSTSHLEPYHSYSYWNYTPYGFLTLTHDAGLRLKEIRPGIDAFTLFIRKALGAPEILNWFFLRESPINAVIGFLGFISGKKKKEINLFKLMFCGQFSFFVQKD